MLRRFVPYRTCEMTSGPAELKLSTESRATCDANAPKRHHLEKA
jgi:hypothetical protein